MYLWRVKEENLPSFVVVKLALFDASLVPLGGALHGSGRDVFWGRGRHCGRRRVWLTSPSSECAEMASVYGAVLEQIKSITGSCCLMLWMLTTDCSITCMGSGDGWVLSVYFLAEDLLKLCWLSGNLKVRTTLQKVTVISRKYSRFCYLWTIFHLLLGFVLSRAKLLSKLLAADCHVIRLCCYTTEVSSDIPGRFGDLSCKRKTMGNFKEENVKQHVNLQTLKGTKLR